MKYAILYTLIFSLIFSGCIKEEDQEHNISGRLFQGCTNQPIANKEIVIFQHASSNWIGQVSGGIVGTTTTDNNGYFKLSFKSGNGNRLKIQTAAGAGFATLIDGIPGDKDLENVLVFYPAATTIKVKLNVINPYTAADTLFITNFSNLSSFQKVPGPFPNGLLYTALNYPILNYFYDPASYQEPLRYKINNNNWSTKLLQLLACDTTRVTVDIN
jgi:hypothetical protein